VFDGDPRALAQYLLNIAHEIREILARLGLRSLREARGRADLLQLLDHPSAVGSLDVRAMLAVLPERHVEDPVYLEKDYRTDDLLIDRVRAALVAGRESALLVDDVRLSNSDKSVGGQLSVDIERMLNHELGAERAAALPAVIVDDRG